MLSLILLIASSGMSQPTEAMGKWETRKGPDGLYRFHNDAVSPNAVQLKGISMTGFETGTRETQSGGGYWLFDPQDQSTSPLTIIKNVIDTAISMGAKIIRIPICGSGWLQNYKVKNWGNQVIATYQDWVDTAVNQATAKGIVVVLDNHLWAIGKETVTTRNQGMEDGCTGINKVCVGVPSCVDSCAPHDWYGQYTSARTGKTYNQGDGDIWECAIANADGCTLDNIKRNNNQEHFLNVWYDLANHYKSNSYVWFELQRAVPASVCHFQRPCLRCFGGGCCCRLPTRNRLW